MTGKSPTVENAKDAVHCAVDKSKDAAHSAAEKTGNAAQSWAVEIGDIASAAAGKAGDHSYSQVNLVEYLFKKCVKALEDNELMERMTIIMIDFLIAQAPILLCKKSCFAEAEYLWELTGNAAKSVASKSKNIASVAAGKAGEDAHAMKEIADDTVDATKNLAYSAAEHAKGAAQIVVDTSKNVVSATAAKTEEDAQAVIDSSKSVAYAAADKADNHSYSQVDPLEYSFKKCVKALEDNELMERMTIIMVGFLIAQAPYLLCKKSCFAEAKYLWELTDTTVKAVQDKGKDIASAAAGKAEKEISVDTAKDLACSATYEELDVAEALLSLSIKKYFRAAAAKNVDAAHAVQGHAKSAAPKTGEVIEGAGEKAKDACCKRAGSSDSGVVSKKFKDAEGK